MNSLVLVIKGFIMGIANIIPGVSGGTLALTLGIYEDFINAISHFFSDFKKNVKFLIPVVIGMGLSIVTMSNVISYGLENYPIPTELFFMGLVVGGIPMLVGKVKDKKEKKQVSSYIIAFLTFGLVMVLAFSDEIFGNGLGEVALANLDFIGYVVLFLVGIVAAATMVIPGVSGSLVLMLLGYYKPVVDTIKELTHFKNIGHNFIICVAFGLGVVIGIVVIAKIIEWLLKKYETKTYFGVIGFILASVIAIPVSVMHEVEISVDIVQSIIGLALIVVGYIIGNKLGEK